ncbi:hypothetical protein [Kordia sp.]|uniref:hypothetical protein n=1 Tax=Kordia sp. TaxID=1965332 RepID=UPI003B5CCE0C
MLQKTEFLEIFDETIKLALFDIAEFQKEKAISVMKNFYSEFNLEQPKQFFVYESMKELMQDFDRWKNHVKEGITSWEWNFPMANPFSFWLHIVVKETFHLGYKRKGPGLFTIKEETHDLGTNEVSKKLLHEMWSVLNDYENFEQYEDLLERETDILYEEDKISDFLEGLLDVTSQESTGEVFFLGTDFKLVYEVAACNYLAKYHNVKRNSSYIKNITDMLMYCGVVMAFDEVCIICKKKVYTENDLK